MFANNNISTLLDNQLPDFIKSDHPEFVNFIKKYYSYLELEDKAVNINKQLYDFADIDTTRSDLLKYFKNKIIPSFPEETELSTKKVIKAARDFYAKKGTPDSFKFLFRILYNKEIDVYYPKEDILRASDGKWKLPQALRLSISDTLTFVPGGNVSVFVSTANVVNSNGINLITSGIVSNNFIKIGEQKRKVVSINSSGDFLTVEIPFADTGNTTYIYNSERLFKVTVNPYENFNFAQLERRLGIGEISRTTCTIEKAIKTIDKDTGREIVEIYVSNVKRLFEVNENLLVDYTDQFGNQQQFSSKIVSLISNISLYRNRLGVLQQGKRYKTGDPVVFFGGLNLQSGEPVKAVATVNQVSTGDIEFITLEKNGYYFRDWSNSLVKINSTSGIGANVVIDAIWEDGGANSENFVFNTDSIINKRAITLANTGGYDFENVTTDIVGTTGAGNTVSTINLSSTTYSPSSVNDYYKSFVVKIISGTGAAGSPNSALISGYNGTTKIATLESPLAVAASGTSTVRLYANANTEIGRAMSFETHTLGKIRFVNLRERGSFFEDPPTFDAISLHENDFSYDAGYLRIPTGQFSDYNKTTKTIRLNSSNASYVTSNGFYNGCRLFLETGRTAHYVNIVDYVVEDVALPTQTKTLYLDGVFENNINNLNIQDYRMYIDFRSDVRGTGRLGVIEVVNPGSGYSPTDQIVFDGTGYGGSATLGISSGRILAAQIVNRGEGYVVPPEYRILNASGGPSSGSGAVLNILTLSDGELIRANTNDLGAIQTFSLINRGYDYSSTPLVSLKVVDILTDNLAQGALVLSGNYLWQGGATNADSTFNGRVDEIYRADSTNTVIRVFDYSGNIDVNLPLKINTATQNITVNLYSTNSTISFNGVNPLVERQYPFYYGDGLAKANAEFLSGLIKYSGFYLNSDGFISADKKLQNNNYFHNYSYEIQSDVLLNDFKDTIYRAAHPAGMQLLSKFLIKDAIDDKVNISTDIHISNTAQTTNINTGFSSAVVYGNNSNFGVYANANDLIVINTGSIRQFTKLIKSVDAANDILVIESAVGGIMPDGRLTVANGSSQYTVTGNTVPIINYIEPNDVIRFNVNTTTYDILVTQINQNIIAGNTSVPFDANGVVFSILPTLNVVNYKIIKTNG